MAPASRVSFIKLLAGMRSCSVARQSTWGVFALLLSVSAVTAVWLISLPPAACGVAKPGYVSETKFQAVKVVVRPWEGRHKVYGVFIIPDQFKRHRRYGVTLRIEGIDCDFLAGSAENEDKDSIVPEGGYYVRRAYLPTRTALWFLLTGTIRNLETPSHWWLIYVDRVH